MAASRKLYNDVAETLVDFMVVCHFENDPDGIELLTDIADAIAGDFKQDNTAFKKDRFMAFIAEHLDARLKQIEERDIDAKG